MRLPHWKGNFVGLVESSIVLPRSRREAFDYVKVPANLMKLVSPSAAANVTTKFPEELDLGAKLEITFRAMGFHFEIVHEVTNFIVDEKIVAMQWKGPFELLVHEHLFADAPEGGTLMTNRVRFEPPRGMLGFVVTSKMIQTHLHDALGQGQEALRRSMAQEQ
jgi:ligand-binding SRPBCC domain-containing protein